MTRPAHDSGFAARFNAALDDIGIPAKYHGRQNAVAKLFGVSQKGARKWLEGDALPDTWRLAHIARRLDVYGEWLLTGQGPRSTHDFGGAWARQAALDAGVIEQILTIVDTLAADNDVALTNADIAHHIAENYADVAREREHERQYHNRISRLVARSWHNQKTEISSAPAAQQSSDPPGE